MKKLIIRVAKHIFNKIDDSTVMPNDLEIDYVIECSMLEIYRESLNDLLS